MHMSNRRDRSGHNLVGLTRAERLLVILYEYERMTFEEIGMVFDLEGDVVRTIYRSICASIGRPWAPEPEMDNREHPLRLINPPETDEPPSGQSPEST